MEESLCNSYIYSVKCDTIHHGNNIPIDQVSQILIEI